MAVDSFGLLDRQYRLVARRYRSATPGLPQAVHELDRGFR
jgi:hypothetical protein